MSHGWQSGPTDESKNCWRQRGGVEVRSAVVVALMVVVVVVFLMQCSVVVVVDVVVVVLAVVAPKVVRTCGV